LSVIFRGAAVTTATVGGGGKAGEGTGFYVKFDNALGGFKVTK